MAHETDDSAQPWTAKRRAALVLSILKGETSVAEAARKHGLTVAEIEGWQGRFLLGADNALRSRPKDDEALKDNTEGDERQLSVLAAEANKSLERMIQKLDETHSSLTHLRKTLSRRKS